MSRSKSSHNWLRQHFADPYVQKAWEDGLRSRAAYKLLAIQEKDQLLRPGQMVVDLGAAPGGWSQVASRIVGEQGGVFALDILPMDAIVGVDFIQGDFTEDTIYQTLCARLQGRSVDLVISDMAPNMSGMKAVDQPRAMYLVTLAHDLARTVLKPDGDLLIKVFQGEGFDAFRQQLQQNFAKVITRKPEASRASSREVYLLARGYTKN